MQTAKLRPAELAAKTAHWEPQSMEEAYSFWLRDDTLECAASFPTSNPLPP